MPPEITSTNPGRINCRAQLDILGQGFGDSQEAVDGLVTINGLAISPIEWTGTLIRLLVPAAVPNESPALLEVRVNTRIVSRSLELFCP